MTVVQGWCKALNTRPGGSGTIHHQMKLSDREQWRVFLEKWGRQIFVGRTETYFPTFYFLLLGCQELDIVFALE